MLDMKLLARLTPGIAGEVAVGSTTMSAELRDAIMSEREELREQIIQEAGCPRMTTKRQQLDASFPEALDYPM